MKVLVVTRALAAAALVWTAAHLAAPAVRRWRPPGRVPLPVGPLHTEAPPHVDDGAPVVVLLHGIVGSGRSFGAAYDDLAGRVLVPDLLGFGRSMDVPTDRYDADAHVDALVATLDAAGVLQRRTILVGHSMGAVLALRAAGRIADLAAVVAVSAPLYDHEDEALARIGEADPLAALVSTGALAERICSWMCRHRRLAGALWPVLALRWPIPVAADGVLHTWPAYRGSLQSLVLDSGWRDALRAISDRGVPIELIAGDADGVPVEGRAGALAASLPEVRATAVRGADHRLPLSHPDAVRDAIARHL